MLGQLQKLLLNGPLLGLQVLSNLLELLGVDEHPVFFHSLVGDDARHVEVVEELHQGPVLLELLVEYPVELILVVDIVPQVCQVLLILLSSLVLACLKALVHIPLRSIALKHCILLHTIGSILIEYVGGQHYVEGYMGLHPEVILKEQVIELPVASHEGLSVPI